MVVYVHDLNREGLLSYEAKINQRELDKVIEKIIDAGICPLCGSDLIKKHQPIWKRLFSYDIHVICHTHGIVKKKNRPTTLC